MGLRRENGSISSAQCDPLLNHLVCTWDETRRLNEVKFDERRCAATNVQSCGLDLLVLFRIYVYSVCIIFNDIYIYILYIIICIKNDYIYNGNTCLCSGLTRAYRNCTCLHV